jgi:SAM-dependent methyltransferase
MSDSAVTRHYGNAGIAERVIEALRAASGPDAAITPASLAQFDHFHVRGLMGTREIAARLAFRPGEQLIDIGSGIGGPARWFAATSGVRVTGVDLTPEFCAAAEALNAMTGLAGRVRILQGSALALPLPDAAFDAGYSQNVIMNIADKPLFYREAYRVLRPAPSPRAGRHECRAACRCGHHHGRARRGDEAQRDAHDRRRARPRHRSDGAQAAGVRRGRAGWPKA